MKPGTKLSAVMTAVQLRLKSKAPHLEPHLTKTCGFATGLEFRESAFQLNLKSEQVLTFTLTLTLTLILTLTLTPTLTRWSRSRRRTRSSRAC